MYSSYGHQFSGILKTFRMFLSCRARTKVISILKLIQNFAARIVSEKRKYDHITPTLKKLNLHPDKDAVLMFKCMNNLAPEYLSKLFKQTWDIHSYHTRNHDLLHIPRCRTVTAQDYFVYRAVKIWNNLLHTQLNVSHP